jgi:hypothetical protein
LGGRLFQCRLLFGSRLIISLGQHRVQEVVVNELEKLDASRGSRVEYHPLQVREIAPHLLQRRFVDPPGNVDDGIAGRVL